MKKVCTYNSAYGIPRVGHSQTLFGVRNHPSVQGDWVMTSKVVRVADDFAETGEFETVNTLYRKHHK